MGEKKEYRRRRRPLEDMERHRQQVRRRQINTSYREVSRRCRQEEQTYANPRKTARSGRLSKRRVRHRRRKGRGFLLFFLLLMLVVSSYGAAKVWVKMSQWQDKAEKSDFVIAASEQEKIRDVINVAVLGTDEDGFRSDVNMIVSFHIKTGELNMISVPRDTRVVMTDEMISYLEKNDGHVPKRNGVYGQCKLTEVHAYAGEGNRCTFSVAILEDILDITIDYYIKFDLSAFRQVVDAVGGVDFYVPQDMYWDMTDTGGPLINLKEGMQHLNGEKAEQLVRFREGYAAKDLRRIEVQQDFIMALIEKICSSETLLGRLDELLEVVLDCTESNITIGEALKYIKYVKDIDLSKITNETIPGEGGAYFDMDEEGTKALIDRRIYGVALEETEEEITTNR